MNGKGGEKFVAKQLHYLLGHEIFKSIWKFSDFRSDFPSIFHDTKEEKSGSCTRVMEGLSQGESFKVDGSLKKVKVLES